LGLQMEMLIAGIFFLCGNGAWGICIIFQFL